MTYLRLFQGWKLLRGMMSFSIRKCAINGRDNIARKLVFAQ